MLGTKDIDIKIGATDATGTAFRSAEIRMKSFVGAAKGMMGAVGLAYGVKTLMSAAGNAMDYASSLNDASVATQTNVEALQALRHVASLTGASYGQIDKALITLNDNAEKAAKALTESTEKKSTAGKIKEIENYSDAISKLGVDMGYFESKIGYNKIEAYISTIKNGEDSVEAFRQVLRIASNEDIGKVFRRLKIEDFPKWREMGAEMEIFTLKQNEVKESTDSAVKAFQGLGIDPAVFKTLSGEGKIEELAKKFAAAKDQATALSYAMDLMGSKNAPYLQQMLTEVATKGLDPLIQKYKKLGLSAAEIKDLEAAQDEIEKFNIRKTIKTGRALATGMNLVKDISGGKLNAGDMLEGALSANPVEFWGNQALDMAGVEKRMPEGIDSKVAKPVISALAAGSPVLNFVRISKDFYDAIIADMGVKERTAAAVRDANEKADTALSQIKTGRK